MRAICPQLGFKSADVYYCRKKRYYGETKYPFFKMISFAWNGISSFSVVPLRLSGVLGAMALIVTAILTISTLGEYVAGNTIPGWTSLMIVILFFSSVQLICIAVLGEYLGKIFTETKRRPRYIIEEKI
ncbi:hypothetical protein [Maridesulfovibrio zosterae]|uniref:hypothetical protein n=1 Tax=Maridesulfovibrio zosterae TaxID=82171 RepID=UPI001B7FA6A9|nr:hypothetical protein [Maridesulfovibrio zosterae]